MRENRKLFELFELGAAYIEQADELARAEPSPASALWLAHSSAVIRGRELLQKQAEMVAGGAYDPDVFDALSAEYIEEQTAAIALHTVMLICTNQMPTPAQLRTVHGVVVLIDADQHDKISEFVRPLMDDCPLLWWRVLAYLEVRTKAAELQAEFDRPDRYTHGRKLYAQLQRNIEDRQTQLASLRMFDLWYRLAYHPDRPESYQPPGWPDVRF